MGDLAAVQAEQLEPLHASYRGHGVFEQPPVSQGFMLLEELNIVQCFDLASMGHLSADATHLGIEAHKLAAADRSAYARDPRTGHFPVDRVISAAHARNRAAAINMDRAALRPDPGQLPEGPDTTSFVAVDGQGNGVSWIQSLFHSFGSGVMVDGDGYMLNNRLHGFSVDPARPNCLAPGKRPVHTLNTYVITDGNGDLYCVGGTPGAELQVQTSLQIMTGMLDFELDPQQAIEAPRWGRQGDLGVVLEGRFDEEVVRDLERRGHDARAAGPWMGSGRAQVIRRLPNGVLQGGSDPRADGRAAGY